ncbi:hypothetical protein [Candidatus Enterococcus clewellii]|uniref:Uncharacterized protein n=1 Tax=Candidatus Enterococcus clewellii TaxID=1834193 RepID=A0A242K4H4_9ENTE|nr:hypothetical protein [Enterococcus sp. 9E7_DIV0242]OTP13700.1 hypothetical protein A5888_003178 [Enterococcus sp. 9E7_DIV0242]
MKIKHLLEILDPETVVNIVNHNKYSLAEVSASELTEFPFNELEIREIDICGDGTLNIRLKKF